jgi:phytoene synthase
MSVTPSPTALADPATLEAAYARCRDITRERARNFHYGIRLSPEPQRSAIYAVYAWMRLADDLVDSCDAADIAGLEHRIAGFRAHTTDALQGRPSNDDPLWLAIADTAQRFKLSPEHFHYMLDGQMEDAHRTSYDTFDQLVEYCRRVASTVGLICIEIWGFSDPRAPELAAQRGIAFQLTNILRDVSQDHDIGRVYLPREDFERFGISPVDLRYWKAPEAARQIIDINVQRAAAAYERSKPLDEMIGACGRPTLWAMTTIYRRLLEKIAADPQRVAIGRRVRVSAIHKGAIALRAKWLARFVQQPPASAMSTSKASV